MNSEYIYTMEEVVKFVKGDHGGALLYEAPMGEGAHGVEVACEDADVNAERG